MIPLTSRFAALGRPEVEVMAGPEQINNTTEIKTFTIDKILTKCLFKYIQVVHHDQIIQMAMTNQNFPRGMMRQVNKLTDFIKPACPNGQTTQRVKQNTQNWMSVNMQILKDHYSVAKEDLLTCIHALGEQEWETACRWAKTRFKHKLKDETIQNAKIQIMEGLRIRERVSIRSLDSVAQSNDKAPQTRTSDSPTSPVISLQRLKEFPPENLPGTFTPMGDRPCITKTIIVPVEIHSVTHNDTLDVNREEPNLIQRRKSLYSNVCAQVSEAISPVCQSPIDAVKESCEIVAERGGEMMSGLQQRIDSCLKTQSESSFNLSHSPGGRALEVGEMAEGDLLDHAEPPAMVNVRDQSDQLGPNITRHPNTSRKMSAWTMSVIKPIVLIGDSNLSRIPYVVNSNVQVDSFPGAKFVHIAQVLQKLTPNTQVQKIILSVGINNREQNPHKTAIKQLQGLWRAAKIAFPYATVYTPLINFSEGLPRDQQENLKILNVYIKDHTNYIKLLSSSRFKVDTKDHVHWSKDTALEMVSYWLKVLNC